jgi:hypothetical protein
MTAINVWLASQGFSVGDTVDELKASRYVGRQRSHSEGSRRVLQIPRGNLFEAIQSLTKQLYIGHY